jgi:hypothetical protein
MGPHGRAVTVQRGWIEEDTTAGLYTHSGGARRVDFLFNPATISTNYSMGAQEESIPLPPGMDPRDSSGVYQGVTNQHLSFELLFDRSFEVAGGDSDGVWRDAKAFLTLVGVEDESALAGANGSGTAIGVMMFVPVWVRFGARSPLRYFGVIRSLGINYTLFSPTQIPIRGAISVSVQLMPKNVSTSSASPEFDRGPDLHADEIRDLALSVARDRLAREKG